MNGWTVTMGQYGQLGLYLCSDASKAPLAAYRGFVSFQDVEDFFTFALMPRQNLAALSVSMAGGQDGLPDLP
jgi:hypothetical protein